jgi:excisionase family DNA binding protein
MRRGPDFLTVKEAAALVGVSKSTIKSRIDRERLPATKRGGIYFIERRDLESWTDKRKGKRS